MDTALNASESVETRVGRNHETQLEDVSRRKLATMAMTEKMPRTLPDNEAGRRLLIIVIAIVTIALVALVPAAQKAHQAQVDENLDLQQNDSMRGLSPAMKQGIVNARAEEAMKKIPQAPTGVVPPQLAQLRAGDHVTLVSPINHCG